MELLRKFYIPLWERRVWNKVVWNSRIWKGSVNSSYIIGNNWKIARSSKSIEQQKKIKNVISSTNRDKDILEWKILLKVVIHQVTKKNKDGSSNFSQVVDIDNTLKHLIDTLNNNVIKDDNQIYWIIVQRKLNEEEFSYFELELYNFDENKIFQNINSLDEKYETLYKNKTILPRWITPTSFNKLFSTVKKGKIIKKIKTDEGRNYSNLLKRNVWKVTHKLIKKDNYILILNFALKGVWIRDLDNLFKSTIDSYSWILYPDDKYISTLIALKKDSEEKNEEVSSILLSK